LTTRFRTTWTRLWRRLLIGQTVALVIGLLAYRLLGHRLIESMYENRSIGVFARESRPPLESYLGAADSVVADIGLAMIVLILAQLAAYSIRRRTGARSPQPRSRPTTAPDPTPLTLSRGKKVLFTLFLVSIPVMFVVVSYSVRYVQYRSGLRVPEGLEDGTWEPPPMPRLTPAQLLQIGYAHRGDRTPLRSYLNYPEEKPDGVVRIGIFGDSYAEGEEAAPEHDISSHLEHRLRDAGIDDVEVINFGVSGYGMSQTMLLWEYLGRRYALDYAIVMPFWFHIQRDTSFLFIDDHFGPLHGLYVLEDGASRYIPVAGDDRLDSCRRYFRPLPPLRYWRYDARVPMVVRPLLPSPHGRRGNPFYYTGDGGTAAIDTYRQLFRELAAEVRHVIVYTDEVLAPELSDMQSDSVHVLPATIDDLIDRHPSLYRAPRHHPSGLGYELYATELAALLLGAERPVFEMLRMSPELVPPAGEETLPDPGGLSTLSDITLSLAGSPVAAFNRREAGEPRWWRVNQDVDFTGEGIVSLAAYTNDGAHLFIPLSFPLREGDEVAIACRLDGEPVRIPIGSVVHASGIVGQLAIDWARLDERNLHGNVRVTPGDEFDILEVASRASIENVRLLIGDRPALIGEIRTPMSRLAPESVRRMLLGRPWTRTVTQFRPAISRYVFLRSRAGQFVDVEEIPATGTLDLTWTDGDGRRHALPLSRYEVEGIGGPPFDPAFAAPLAGGRHGK
jgi:hypothetical protein